MEILEDFSKYFLSKRENSDNFTGFVQKIRDEWNIEFWHVFFGLWQMWGMEIFWAILSVNNFTSIENALKLNWKITFTF